MNEEVRAKEEQPEEGVRSGESDSQGVQKAGAVSKGDSSDGGVVSDNGDVGPKGEAPSSAGASPSMPPTLPMILVLGMIAIFSGVLVVLVYEYTAPIIAEKERLALEAAVFQVVPGADKENSEQVSFSLTASDGLVRINEESTQPANLYAVYDGSRALLGFAMEGSAQGYQDVVSTLFGYDAGKQQIVGMTILKSVDTPGLGDKGTIEKNKAFMANFQALDVSLKGDNSALANPIETVKHGTKTQPWQVDAMSGATITSRAIAKGMSETAGRLLPLLVENLPALTQAQAAVPDVSSSPTEDAQDSTPDNTPADTKGEN